MEPQSTFKKRINELFRREKDRREAEGERMTRQDYATRIGTTVNSLRGWLSGSGQPDANGLARIAEVEKVSVDWLVGKSSSPQIEQVDDPQKAWLINAIKEADLETLTKMQQFYNFLEYQKQQGGLPAAAGKS